MANRDGAESAPLGVFVSYAWADVARVRPVADGLAAAGHRVWVDTEQIHPASRFMDEIQPAIADLEAFVFFYSGESAASTFCLLELDTAVASGSTIVPIWLETPRAPLPAAIDGLAGVSAFDQTASSVLERLLAALRLDAKLQRTLKSLSAAERQWRQAGRPDDLLLTRRRLEELADTARSEWPESLAKYVDRSRVFEQHSTTETRRLRRGDGIGQVHQHLQQGDPKAALATLLSLASQGLDSTLRPMLTQALTQWRSPSDRVRTGATRTAIKRDRSLWAWLSGTHSVSCVHFDGPLGAPGKASGRAPMELVDLAIEPNGGAICVAAKHENVLVFRPICRPAPDDRSRQEIPFSEPLTFERFLPSDRLRRDLVEMLCVGPLNLLFDVAPQGILNLDFSPDGRWLAMAHADGMVRVYDFANRRPVRWGHGFRAGVLPRVQRLPIASGEFIRFSHGGRYLLSVGCRPRWGPWRWQRRSAGDMLVYAIIDTSTWKHADIRSSWRDGDIIGGVTCARISDDERWLFVADGQESAWLWPLQDGTRIEVPHKGVTQAEFTLDGRGLVTIGVDNVLRGWFWSPDSVGPDSVADERIVVPQVRPTRRLLRDPQEPWMWVVDDTGRDLRGVYCDVFGDDPRLLELAREAVASNRRPRLP
ncbi:toll/interleukin-1 receptor domain-containing protein [Variovorax sp. YR216]|uniref:toll/interleukin-1 receptor domain-containing protein n=1 Tax=Variovorax sp. YR216 TaxID=1882828 RepID=UPI0008962E2A|nr:TIR domain-containing protein [Variovorax sp. YR216]SEB24339.1 TIR domain-containing protein [Variovorax sp. YR216]